MQLYVMKNRAIAEDIMARAAAAGYEALLFTSDANVFGSREWDKRNYVKPGKPRPRAILDAMRHPRWLIDVLLRKGIPQFLNIEAFLPPGAASAVGGSTIIPQMFEPTITWTDIAWIRRHWPGKLLVKGVLSVEDARRAADAGCDGIVLTNHGGRQLDYCVAPIEVLGEIAAAVGNRLTIIVDSGFRRGSDVAKALALGAHTVMIGRAALYGLAADGEHGVRRSTCSPSSSTGFLDSSAAVPWPTCARRCCVEQPARAGPTACPPVDRLGCQRALGFGGMRCDRIHQARREAVIGLEPQLLQAGTHLTHPSGREACLDDGGDERGELGGRPALLAQELRVDEVKAVEGMVLVLYPPVHVRAAAGAGIAQDRGVAVHDFQLLLIGGHRDLVARYHRNQ
jgi:hypothetical protein